MRARLLPNAAVGLLALTAVACATTGAPAPRPAAQAAALPGTPGCFWLRNVYDWTVLNDSELIIHAPLAQNGYLVKLFEPVFDLDFHIRLGFQDVEHTGLICGPSRDYLIVRGYAPPRIPIVAVQKLTLPEQAQLLRAAHKPLPYQLRKLLPTPPTPPAPPATPATPATPT